jgi:hypothetical protein
MPEEKEQYRGYEISWSVSHEAGTKFWSATAAIVRPPNSLGIVKGVHAIEGPRNRFMSGGEARDRILYEAKAWIDEEIGRRT